LHFSERRAIEFFAITQVPKKGPFHMLSIEDIRARLAGADIPEIVKATGLSYNTVKAIRDGAPGARYETIKLLTEYFEGRT
jgi:hypothetical protein